MKQLIVMQGSWILASVYLFVCACVTLRNARGTSFSVWVYSWNVHPYIIRTCYITSFHGTKWLWVSRLHDEYTYQAVNSYTRKWICFEYCHSLCANCSNNSYYSWQVLTRFPWGSSVCIHVCTSIWILHNTTTEPTKWYIHAVGM